MGVGGRAIAAEPVSAVRQRGVGVASAKGNVGAAWAAEAARLRIKKRGGFFYLFPKS